ncbi:MAG TPA: methyltransferase domain-containing protein [Candidatus Cybelea sp.]
MAAHPLARALIARLGPGSDGPVLDFAAGSGRNTRALRAAGLRVVPVADSIAESAAPLAGITARFAAALSTHGLLHGTPSIIANRVASIARRLEPDGLLYATFGSSRDARFGEGKRIDDWTFAPEDGDERGVVHGYFDRERLTALLEPHFAAESLEERSVDDVVGAWAHRESPLRGAVHWFVIAVRR